MDILNILVAIFYLFIFAQASSTIFVVRDNQYYGKYYSIYQNWFSLLYRTVFTTSKIY